MIVKHIGMQRIANPRKWVQIPPLSFLSDYICKSQNMKVIFIKILAILVCKYCLTFHFYALTI